MHDMKQTEAEYPRHKEVPNSKFESNRLKFKTPLYVKLDSSLHFLRRSRVVHDRTQLSIDVMPFSFIR